MLHSLRVFLISYDIIDFNSLEKSYLILFQLPTSNEYGNLFCICKAFVKEF